MALMAGLSTLQRRVLEASDCEVRCDDLTRTLYATDASIYRVRPAAVAFPRSAREAAMVIQTAAEAHIPVIPRGAGTGLTGGALGEGLVVDLARHSRRIDGFDLERRVVRVGAGVVLDQLNSFLRDHGLWFGPDVATSSRATLGGMIGNNSSGSHAPVYGTTVEHLEALEVVLTDGTVAVIGASTDGLSGLRNAADDVVSAHSTEIVRRFPSGLVKRWPGYGFDQALEHPGDLTRLVCGSEGTLAAVTSAVLRVVPRPKRRGLGVLFFQTLAEAMTATVEILDLEPAAIEHIDQILLEQTRGQRPFDRARALLGLDEQPCESLLLVEFFQDVDQRLKELEGRSIGSRRLMLRDPEDQELVWSIRRAGLSLLTGCKGSAKPTTCIEDVCVRPERLPEYVAGLREILGREGLKASFYGHAASGELHVRPALDLHRAEDLITFRRVSDEVADLCRRFKGSIAAEHGVGIARTEYLESQIGPELMEASREIKRLLDPGGMMNPGKIVGDGRYQIDADLRLGAGSNIVLPFVEIMGFIHKDGSFVGNLEQCNGCGGCLKDTPTMCPTFVATGEELDTTRGRANTIRAVLDGRLGRARLTSSEMNRALSRCLSCKACRTECPSNVDLAALKAELIHARHGVEGIPFRDRVIAAADVLGRLGSAMPSAANAVVGWKATRGLLENLFGFDRNRPLPGWTAERFDHWFAARQTTGTGARGRVTLWDDTWVRYHEPNIGRAAVTVLEAAGFEVSLATGRRCCGRPATSRGLLDDAKRLGRHNLELLQRSSENGEPIVFLEPSCYSMFVDEYRQFGLPGADEVAGRCRLFEDLLLEVVEAEPGVLPLRSHDVVVAIQGHCHAEALGDSGVLPRLASRIPGADARLLATGCCGMAGAFGVLRQTADLSRAVAAPLVGAVEALPDGSVVVATGTSCRHQIADLTRFKPVHMAELLADHLMT